MKNQLLSWARERGYEVAWGPASVIDSVRRELEQRMATGEIKPGFASVHFAFAYPAEAAGKSVVVIAVPRPAHRVKFEFEEETVEALLPPTYFRYRHTTREVRDDLASNGLPGHAVELIEVPLKSLAARLGLVQYGKNNIAYARGMGSYMQLVGCVTDAPLELNDGWKPREPRLLDKCSRCESCRRRCPTAAIAQDRVLLRADSCLTAANETAGEWPSWVKPNAHHTLIGCLACQRVCPANPVLPITDSGVTFSAEETQLLMSGDATGPSWKSIARKCQQLGQEYHGRVFGRNLRAFVSARRAREAAAAVAARSGIVSECPPRLNVHPLGP